MNQNDPTFIPPDIKYRGPTNSEEMNAAWKNILYDGQRVANQLSELEKEQINYERIFSLEMMGLAERMRLLEESPAAPITVDPLLGNKIKKSFSDASLILQSTATLMADYGAATLPLVSRVNKLNVNRLSTKFFPKDAIRLIYIDQNGNPIELPPEAQVEETLKENAIDDSPETYYYQRISVPHDSSLNGVGIRFVLTIDDNAHHRMANLLEFVPFPEYMSHVRQVKAYTGKFGGIPSVPVPGGANLQPRVMFLAPGYMGNLNGVGEQKTASSRQIYAFPKQEVISVEIDIWQPTSIIEGDKKVFTLGLNHAFLGLADFKNEARIQMKIPRPLSGWSTITSVLPLLSVDGNPPFAIDEVAQTRATYLRPDGLMGVVNLNDPIPNPEEILLEIFLKMDQIAKAPPFLSGVEVFYRP